jgi:hypothetical protein
MKRYRKNSEEVEAVQFDGTIESIDEIKELIGEQKANMIDEDSITPHIFTFVGGSSRFNTFFYCIRRSFSRILHRGDK